MAFVIWAVLCVVCGWVIFADACCLGRVENIKHPVLKRVADIGLLLAFLAIVASPLYYEFPNYGSSKVVTFKDDRVTERPFGAFVWEFGGAFSNIPNNIGITSSVTLAVDSPKVRTLRYTIDARIINPTLFFAKKERRHMFAVNAQANPVDTKQLVASSADNTNETVEGEITDLVAYQMFEFNNIFSNGLAMLNNPLNPVQQDAFKLLIECFINANLEQDGIAVKTSPFTIE
ncbi:hypothetical protein A2524_04220 [Candidatus Wolfebacteria bacterium RIFOXYD12_FULL_48_21]|uniref:Uncharacterized protein n=1 Tax=Candidatus Wolfebacteria bacterium RIFOXYD1_FULL_48_65 TaxID=1802561 RepID=A0A1F8E1P0_9BACT|nr:MAG: hypothetical protein A2610_01855 [Candidatus Wolfebacteria bacterium RIFOXYD1_FULL_48_65]OGM95390.1 MAG: hypothetical protein A2524_04220 [Candidatus Wolfebacteria bacterium RIFOXYD12_FULL_48_21]OGM97695.1 MAG: hypothetical protein A2532_04405 [Candidatus Wolfebacteria bacterium RIFOXYD2_FULL_48_11]